MKEIIKPAFRLFLISAIAALLLGGTYMLTKDPIAQQELAAQTAARKEVLSEAQDFELLDVALPEEYESIQAIYRGVDASGETVGYAISLTAKGYKPNISLTLGVYPDGTVSALNVGSNEESPGLGANAEKPEFYEQFSGMTGDIAVVKGAAGENEISAISGATITSKGIANAVNLALECFGECVAK